MKKFLIKICLFILPLIILIVPPYWLFKASVEDLSDLQKLISDDKPYILGLAYCHIDRYLKVKTIINRKPYHVWAVGSSRVMQFRAEFFQEPFYNLGISSICLEEIQPLISFIPKDKYPTTIILGLDHWWFRLPKSEIKKNVLSYDSEPKIQADFNIIKSIAWHYVWRNQIASKALFETNYIKKYGLTALVFQSGFRNDGSYCYGDQINKLLKNDSTAREYQFENTIKTLELEIKNKIKAYEVNEQAFADLRSLLKFCNDNQIFVIGVLPPLPDAINIKMNSTNIFDYRKLMNEKLTQIFTNANQEFYNFTELQTCEGSDSGMIDSTHGSEVIYAKILLEIKKKDSQFLQSVDKNKLLHLLQSSKNQLEIFKD